MHPFESQLRHQWPPAADPAEQAMVAVSGGADSVALLAVMNEIRGGKGLFAAHFNHRLRGAESDQHEAFVVELCQNSGIPLLRQTPAEPIQATAGGEGLENAARTARYEFLHSAAKSVGARYLLTAHSADDQVETVLQRILRGTGIAGLGGIPRVRPLSEAVSVVRPLLTVRRSAIRAYLLDRNLPWCDDSSNVDPRFSRNRIRSELLPLLHEHYSRHVDQSLLRLSTLAREAQSIIDAQVEQLHVACTRKSSTGDAVILKTSALRSATPYVVRELLIRIWKEHGWPLRDMTAERWDELATRACQQPSLHEPLNLPGNIRVEHTGQTLVITPPPTRS